MRGRTRPRLGNPETALGRLHTAWSSREPKRTRLYPIAYGVLRRDMFCEVIIWLGFPCRSALRRSRRGLVLSRQRILFLFFPSSGCTFSAADSTSMDVVRTVGKGGLNKKHHSLLVHPFGPRCNGRKVHVTQPSVVLLPIPHTHCPRTYFVHTRTRGLQAPGPAHRAGAPLSSRATSPEPRSRGHCPKGSFLDHGWRLPHVLCKPRNCPSSPFKYDDHWLTERTGITPV